MKRKFYLPLLLIAATFSACSSVANPKESSTINSGGTSISTKSTSGFDISARGAIGGLSTADSPRFLGSSGSNIRLAILAPEAAKGADVPSYLPQYIQGLLMNNFTKYSPITLTEKQFLDRLIEEQKIATSSQFYSNVNNSINMGNMTDYTHLLFGSIQKLSGNNYSLQLSITDANKGTRMADSKKDGALSQLNETTGGSLINAATVDLLDQMGVQLTDTGRKTLLAGNRGASWSEAFNARGLSANATGQEVTAFLNFTQSVAFDPSQMEALSKFASLSSSISSGSLSERIVTDIQARNQWIEAFKETASFFNDYPPFEIIFDPNLIQIGETKYDTHGGGTADLGLRIALNPSKAGFDALNALLGGLESTTRRNVWGFDGWPLRDIEPKISGTVVLRENNNFVYNVNVELVNEENKTLGRKTVTLNTGKIVFSPGNRAVPPPDGTVETIIFPGINAADLTPTFTIKIVSVNGIQASELNASGKMRIDTGDLTTRAQVASNQQIQAEYERAAKRKKGLRIFGYTSLGLLVTGGLVTLIVVGEKQGWYDKKTETEQK